jgi:HlyD family secretion protein
LRHDAGGDFVFLLGGDTIERRAVRIGATNISMLEIVSGLADGDAVALPADITLKTGDRVTPAL